MFHLLSGFQFVILVLGESGLGKSTLVNSLFLTDVLTSGGISTRPEKTREIREHKVGRIDILYYKRVCPRRKNGDSHFAVLVNTYLSAWVSGDMSIERLSL